MPYGFKLSANQRLFLDQSGDHTVVTTMSSGAGQLQQASSRLTTGQWTAPPQAYQTEHGIILRIQTVQGDCYLQFQSSQITMLQGIPFLAGAQPVEMTHLAEMPASMSPMQPMKPLTMGNMEMTLNPMQMRMGTMEMQMGTTISTASDSSTASSANRFCSQCGAAVKAGDRFCSSCGHSLS